MKLINTILSATLSLILIWGCASNKDEEESLLQKGDSELDKGNFEKAIGFYKQAISQNPSRALAYSSLGGVYGELCQTKNQYCDSVFVLLDKAYELDSTDRVTIFNLAYASGRLKGDFGTSISLYSKLISLTTDEDTIAMLQANRANMHLGVQDTLSYCEDIKAAYTRLKLDELESYYLFYCSNYFTDGGDLEESAR